MSALSEFTAQHSGHLIQWGREDCCTIMSDWVLLRTGRDPLEGLRGTYRGWKQAARLWRSLGGVEKAVGAKLDGWFPRTTIIAVKPGDVALVKTHHRAVTCAIVDTCGLWMPTQAGYRLVRGKLPIVTFWSL